MGAQGTALLDFGAFPGASDASVAVASAGIGAGSLAECWTFPAATADHTADEHLVESLKVMAGGVSAGVGFTIYGVNTSELNEPVEPMPNANSVFQATATTVGQKIAQPAVRGVRGGTGTRLYGKWNIGWVWN